MMYDAIVDFTAQQANRVRIIEITFEALEILLKMDGSDRLSFQGMPKDGKILSIRERGGSSIQLKVQSEEFSPVPEGHLIPNVDIVVERIPAVQRGREFL